MPEALPAGEKTFRGIPVSAGVCQGKILVLDRSRPTIPKREVSESGIPEEINRLGRRDDIDLRHLKEPCIIIGHDLTPTNTAQLDKRNVLGFATDVGSKTSHTAIMARSLRIPAVVGLKHASGELQSGQYALLDGFNGVIVVSPTDQTLYDYRQLISKHLTLDEKLRELLLESAITLDGRRICLSANIEHAADSEAVKANGAEGVGLFR